MEVGMVGLCSVEPEAREILNRDVILDINLLRLTEREILSDRTENQ